MVTYLFLTLLNQAPNQQGIPAKSTNFKKQSPVRGPKGAEEAAVLCGGAFAAAAEDGGEDVVRRCGVGVDAPSDPESTRCKSKASIDTIQSAVM